MDSGVGHDGKTSGIFLPNADAQEALARSIYAKAGLDPRETLYVETHGTGTAAGMLFTPLLVSIGNVNLAILQATMQKFNPSPRCSAAKQGESLICPLYVYPIVLSLMLPHFWHVRRSLQHLSPQTEKFQSFLYSNPGR